MKLKYLFVGLSVLFAWSCSSSDDDDNSSGASTFVESGRPSWSVDLSGSDAAPGWQDIDRSLYESWMYVTVKLQDELAVHAGAGDLMVAFIGDECRTRPAMPSNRYADGSVYFVLTIGGNDADRGASIRLCYYCASLHSLFAIESRETFAPESSYGNTEDYVPLLLQGCKKYPLQRQLTVQLPSITPFTPDESDIVAVFAGSECRGVGVAGQPFTVFRTTDGETLDVRYYSAKQAGVYTLKQKVGQEATIVLNF